MRAEERQVLAQEVERWRRSSYADLRARWLDAPDAYEATAASGRTHQVEVEAFWDDQRTSPGNLRVVVAVGSGFSPPSASFIVAPDGSFVGE